MDLTIPLVKELIARGKIFPKSKPYHHVVEIDGNDRNSQPLIIKYGHQVWKTEALAMQLVHQHTNVPVPKLLAYLSERHTQNSRTGYIVMEKVPGIVLAEVIDALDEAAVTYVASQLKGYVEELHKLDWQGWGLPGKGGMYHRTHFTFTPGPTRLTSTTEFINYHASQVISHIPTSLGDLFQAIDLDKPPIFSHGDLLPGNIMYDRASGRITAIIDWECAGGYPYFWNAFLASRRVAYSSGPEKNWIAIYTAAMGQYSEEIKKFGPYHTYAHLEGSYELHHECECCE